MRAAVFLREVRRQKTGDRRQKPTSEPRAVARGNIRSLKSEDRKPETEDARYDELKLV